MSRRLVISLLGSLGVLAIALLLAWSSLPGLIATKIDGAARDGGVKTSSRISDFSWHGMRVDTTMESPLKLVLPPLVIRWSLAKIFSGVPFTIHSLAGMPRAELGFAEVEKADFEIEGVWRRGKVSFSKLEGTLDISSPFHAELSMSPHEAGNFRSWAIDLWLPSQDLSKLVGTRLKLVGESFLEGIYERTVEGHSFHLGSDDDAVSAEWESEAGQKFLLSLKTLDADLEWKDDGSRPFIASTKYALFWQGLKSDGTLSIQGKSFADVSVVLQDLIVSKKFVAGVYALADARVATHLSARVLDKNIVAANISTTAKLKKMLRAKTPFEDISLSLNVACGALRDFSLENVAAACALSGPGFEAEVDKILEKHPLRGTTVTFAPTTDGIYRGNFMSQWQGALLKSDVLELDRSLSGLRMKLTGDKLSLSDLLLALDNEKIGGKGVVDLSLNLSWAKGVGLTIDPALFESRGKGEIHYADPALQGGDHEVDTLGEFQDLLAKGQQAMVLKALENFHYDRLHARVTRNPKLLMRAELSLSGSNPELAHGQPFEINVPVTGDLESLLMNSVLHDFERRLPKSSN
ncbi:MAG: YdbH domain-containing protein [Bdellovibrionota bacterium]